MSYRHYPPSNERLIGYDPERDVPQGHLARLVDEAVEETIGVPRKRRRKGQPEFDPRLCIKVLIYGYATGVRSSRQLERLCQESLPYLHLTRGDTPSYRTLCRVRREQRELVEAVWVTLFMVGAQVGLKRMGRLVLDSTKLRANASSESVLRRDEFEPVKRELKRILQEAEVVDGREETEGCPGETRLEKVVDREQMRDIVRRVRKQLAQERREGSEEEELEGEEDKVDPPSCSTKISPQMKDRVEEAVEAIEAAEADGLKHLSLTDPDARMMPEGCEKKIRECHSFEAAVDNGLLVVGQSGQVPDQERLEAIVQAAQTQEPQGVIAVDADSAYYSGDEVGRLIKAGIDCCIPTPHTASDLHRGRPIGTARAKGIGKVTFTYEAEADIYRCPEGNELHPLPARLHHGQQVKVYRAAASCQGCAQANDCLRHPTTQHRTMKVGQYHDRLVADQERFAQPEHQERYRHRGCVVETVFGFLRSTLGYIRWLLRGAKAVACEASLFKLAYQIRKLHIVWAAVQ